MSGPRASADRQRRYRVRQRRMVSVYAVAVPARVIETLIDIGRITEAEAECREQVALELSALAEEYASILRQKNRYA